MTSRPNPKRLTDADRIRSVDHEVRQHLINDNRGGVVMKHLATDYGIAERTVRAIIYASREPPAIATKPALPNDANLWERPDLWDGQGIKGPFTPRMVPVI